MQEVAKRKGRFLCKIETAEEAREVGVPQDVEEAWKVVDFSVALEKTKQTLRDKEYIKSGDRAAQLVADSNSSMTGDLLGTSLAGEAGTPSNPMQRLVSLAPSIGQDIRSVSNSQTNNQQDPLPGTAAESLLLLTLQYEQNRIRQLHQHLADLGKDADLAIGQAVKPGVVADGQPCAGDVNGKAFDRGLVDQGQLCIGHRELSLRHP